MRLEKFLLCFFCLLLNKNIFAVESSKTMAFWLTPLVIPDIFSFKAAFEYRLHNKIKLVLPLETKFINYRQIVKWATNKSGKNYPEDLYNPSNIIKPGWNFDYSHIKIATGAGVKIIPWSESMKSAFFIKSIFLVGYDRFNALGAQDVRDGVFLGSALTLGYEWVVSNFICGLELGAEYDYHTNPIEKLPVLFKGFSPLFQFSLGFTM